VHKDPPKPSYATDVTSASSSHVFGRNKHFIGA